MMMSMTMIIMLMTTDVAWVSDGCEFNKAPVCMYTYLYTKAVMTTPWVSEGSLLLLHPSIQPSHHSNHPSLNVQQLFSIIANQMLHSIDVYLQQRRPYYEVAFQPVGGGGFGLVCEGRLRIGSFLGARGVA